MFGLIALYAILWISFHFAAGYFVHVLPTRLIVALPVVGETYDWEREGRIYRRLGIARWKDRLPEAGGFFRGGFAKRRLAGDDRVYLGRFADETCRSELAHWIIWGLALTFFAWNPWQIGAIMVVYGGVVNLPFIFIQRYNRARLTRVARRSARRAHGNRADLASKTVAYKGELKRANEDRQEEGEGYGISDGALQAVVSELSKQSPDL